MKPTLILALAVVLGTFFCLAAVDASAQQQFVLQSAPVCANGQCSTGQQVVLGQSAPIVLQSHITAQAQSGGSQVVLGQAGSIPIVLQAQQSPQIVVDVGRQHVVQSVVPVVVRQNVRSCGRSTNVNVRVRRGLFGRRL